MTFDDCTDMLTQLAIAMQRQMDVPTLNAYYAMLKDVPLELALLGLDQWRQSGPRFFPTAPEIQSFAEKARRQQLALHPWSPCCECEGQPGWRTVKDHRGDPRLERCPCKARHQASLQACGILEPIAVLPGEAGVAESEQVYPRLEQLPAKLQQQIATIAGQKVLR